MPTLVLEGATRGRYANTQVGNLNLSGAFSSSHTVVIPSPDESVNRWRQPASLHTSQEWFWTPEWQAGEAAVTIELNAGLGEVFGDVEDFLADLDR